MDVSIDPATGTAFVCDFNRNDGDAIEVWRNAGSGWSSLTSWTPTGVTSQKGCMVAAHTGRVVVAWHQPANGTMNYRYSTNSGASFSSTQTAGAQTISGTLGRTMRAVSETKFVLATINGASNRVVIGTSEDGGATWTLNQLSSPGITVAPNAQIALDGANAGTFGAGVSNGPNAWIFLLSTDAGATWSNANAVTACTNCFDDGVAQFYISTATGSFVLLHGADGADGAKWRLGSDGDITEEFCPFDASECTGVFGFNRAIREVRTSYGATPTVYTKEAGDTSRINGVLEDPDTGLIYKYDVDLGLDASRRPCGDGASLQSLFQNPGGFPLAVSTDGDPWTACGQKPATGTFSAYYFRQKLRPDLFIAQNYPGTDGRSVIRIDAASNLCTAENRNTGKVHVYGIGYYQTDPGEGGFGIDPSSAQPNVAIAGPNGVQIVQCREEAAGGTGRILNDATKTGYRAAATYNSASWNLTAPTNKAWFADANSVDEFTISGTSLSAGQSYTNGGVDTGFVGQGISAPGIRVSKDGAYIILWDARVHVIDSETMAAVFKTPTITGRIVNGCDMDLLNNYLFCGVQSSAGGVGATSSQVLRWNVFNATSAFGNNAGSTTPNPAPSAAENPYDTPTGGTSGQGNPVTGNDPHETFLGNDLTTTADGIGWSVGQLSWLLGVIMVMGFMGGVFAATRNANVALVATGAGIIVAVAFGLFPWWFLVFVILCGVALWFTVRGGVTAG